MKLQHHATDNSTDSEINNVAKTKKQQKKERVSQTKRPRAPTVVEKHTAVKKITQLKKSPKLETVVVVDDEVDNRDATIRQQEERILQLEEEAMYKQKSQHATSTSEISVKPTTAIVPASGPSIPVNSSALPTNFNGVAQLSSFGNYILLHHDLTVKLLQAQHALERSEKEKRDANDRAFLVESNSNLAKQLGSLGFNFGP